MSQETDSGPGPLKWVVIIGSVVSGFIWGWMAMFVAFVVIIAVLFMIGSMLQKSNDERSQRRDRQLNDDFRSKYGYDMPPLTDDLRQVFDRMSGQTTTSPSPKKFPKEKKALVEISRNLITTALNADRNWEIARNFLPSDLPGSVLTCETTFLMASILKSVIRDVAPPQIVDECLRTVNDVYTEVFDAESTNDLPDEMRRIYGDDRLNVIAEKALKEYEEDGDILFLTCPRFISRIASDPLMMGGAAKQIFEEQRNEFNRVFEKHLRSLHLNTLLVKNMGTGNFTGNLLGALITVICALLGFLSYSASAVSLLICMYLIGGYWVYMDRFGSEEYLPEVQSLFTPQEQAVAKKYHLYS